MEWLTTLFIVSFFSLYWKFFTKKKVSTGETPEIKKNLYLPEKTDVRTTTSFENSKVHKSPSRSSRVSQTRKQRSYAGPLFAQPGEVSKLFGYASKFGDYRLEGPFSIIDLETSDLSPSKGKILEIAILKVDFEGNEIERFETLINPGDGNVGRTDIHKIDFGMLKEAPYFEDVVGRVFEIIQESIVVAHNARFEENFLFSELTDSGYDMDPIPALDTLWLARETVDLPNYTLKDVVRAFSKRFKNPHTALGDVVAVSEVLPEMLSRVGELYYPVSHPRLPDASMPFRAKTR
jgi:DNA polymerase III epsilon subunit-like protein